MAGSLWFWRGTVLLPFSWQLLWKPTSSQNVGTLAVRVWRVAICAGVILFLKDKSSLHPITLPKSVCTRVHAHTHTRITSSSTCGGLLLSSFYSHYHRHLFSLSSCGGELVSGIFKMTDSAIHRGSRIPWCPWRFQVRGCQLVLIKKTS